MFIATLNDMQEAESPMDFTTMSDEELLNIIEDTQTTLQVIIDIIKIKNEIKNHWWFGNTLMKTSRVGYIALRKYNQRASENEVDDTLLYYLDQATNIIDEEKENPAYPVEGVQYKDENGDELSVEAYQEQFRIRPLPSYDY